MTRRSTPTRSYSINYSLRGGVPENHVDGSNRISGNPCESFAKSLDRLSTSVGNPLHQPIWFCDVGQTKVAHGLVTEGRSSNERYGLAPFERILQRRALRKAREKRMTFSPDSLEWLEPSAYDPTQLRPHAHYAEPRERAARLAWPNRN